MGFGRSVRSPNKKQTKKNNRNARVRSYINVEENVKVIHQTRSDGKNKKVARKITKEIDFSKPRDLYNRSNQMKASLKRVNELSNPDKEDILTHVQYLTDNRRAALTIIRNISALITFREKLGKPFRDATSTDMRTVFTNIEKEGWKTKKGEIKEYSS